MRALVARKFNAIFAQIAMVVMCYNACRLHEEKNPKKAEKIYEKMRMRRLERFLTDYSTIVFVPKLQIFATMTPEECADLISKRTAAELLLLIGERMSLFFAVKWHWLTGILRYLSNYYLYDSKNKQEDSSLAHAS